MKKLVLLLMLFGALRSFGAVATNVQNLSAFGTTNRMIAGDGIGISVRYATAQERLLGIRASNLVYSLNLLGIGTNTVILAAGTNVTISTNRTGSNVTYTISVTNTFGSAVSPPLSSVQYNSNSVQSGSSLFVFTNSMVGIGTNAPAYPLHLFVGSPSLTALEISYTNGAGNTVAFQVRNGAGATNFQVEVGGLMRSATIHNSGSITGATATVNALAVTGGTLGAGKVLTDTGGTGAATWETPSSGVPAGYNTNAWTTNVAGTPVIGASSLSVSNATTNFNFYGHNSDTIARLGDVTNVVNSFTNNFVGTNYLFSVIGNYMNLSVQAAKLPTTNFPTIDAGWQNWELIFYPTNSDGFTNPLQATWQFIVPTNYFTNSMKVYGQNILLTTNGPTSTNIYWRASFFRATPGDSTDVHVGSFGSSVSVTQTWAASATGTNKMQAFLIDMGTSSLLQANDFAILKLERINDAADTNQFKGGTSLIGLQLRY